MARSAKIIANDPSCTPDYPPAALRVKATGTTVVRLWIDDTGRVGQSEITGASGPTREHRLLDKTALAVLAKCPFVPGADASGRPVGAELSVAYTWRLEPGATTARVIGNREMRDPPPIRPPVSVETKQCPPPRLPEEALRRVPEGVTKVSMDIDEQGTVADTRVIVQMGQAADKQAIDDAVLAAYRQCTFDAPGHGGLYRHTVLEYRWPAASAPLTSPTP
jgi:TonB family protein